MRPVTVGVLALVVALLAAFLWFVERDLPSSAEREEIKRRVLRMEAGEISGVAIKTSSQELVLERRDSVGETGWRLVEPLEARADGAKVEALVEALTALEKKRTLDTVESEIVGLEQPRLSVTIMARTGKTVLSVGRDVPVSEAVIVATDEGGVFVASDSFVDLVEEDPDAWRARDVVPFRRLEIFRLTAETAAVQMILERQEGRFKLEAPVRDDASEAAVSRLLADLEEMEVVDFVEASRANADLGLESPTAVISLDIEGEARPFVIRFGALDEKTGHRVAATPEGTFLVTTELPELLREPLQFWQSAAWSTLEPFAVDRLSVEGSEGVSLLARQSGQWRRDDVVVPDELVDDLLEGVAGIEGVGLRRVTEGEAEPLLRLELSAGERVESLALVAQGSSYFATREGRVFALEVEEPAVGELLAALRAVRLAESEEENPESGSS